MNDQITIGLDFGTHQTKICVQRIPDEGHGEPNYEFFQFADLQGSNQYFLPSIVQVNDDNTVSYGYVSENRSRQSMETPTMPDVVTEEEFDIDEEAMMLYDKYATYQNTSEDIKILEELLHQRLQNIIIRNNKQRKEVLDEYNRLLKQYKEAKNIYRYFKLSAFAGGEWNRNSTISSRTLCVWYLAYVIFLLEEKYGTYFAINMGIPAGHDSFELRKNLAVSILASAYNLVENVYKNDFDAFLNENVEDLKAKTENIPYSDSLKKEYNINIFPEAYASLITMTSKGKLPEGMCLTADIGGGTTDISFFTIKDGAPIIYRYWSISKGLNYIAERSGFDYAEGNFNRMADSRVIKDYNKDKEAIIDALISSLRKKIRDETSIPVKNLMDALQNRVLVYTGGGSTFPRLTDPIITFKDVRSGNMNIWEEENIKDKFAVNRLYQLLATAFGLAVCKKDEVVKLVSSATLFDNLPGKNENTIEMVSKDQC